MKHVTLSIVANNLYPHQNDLDFIMCFRYNPAATVTLAVGETSILASSSLINAQVINFKANVTDMDAQNSIFRVGILNYYTEDFTANHVASYVPTLLRVDGYLQSAEVTTNDGIAFFFDAAKITVSE